MTPLPETIAAVLMGGGLWAFLAARAKANNPAAIAASQATLVKALTAQTKSILEEHTKDREALRGRVDHLDAQIAECQSKHEACETRVADLQDQIDQMMKGPVATYPHGGANASD